MDVRDRSFGQIFYRNSKFSVACSFWNECPGELSILWRCELKSWIFLFGQTGGVIDYVIDKYSFNDNINAFFFLLKIFKITVNKVKL